jgi:hypothetical protein
MTDIHGGTPNPAAVHDGAMVAIACVACDVEASFPLCHKGLDE